MFSYNITTLFSSRGLRMVEVPVGPLTKPNNFTPRAKIPSLIITFQVIHLHLQMPQILKLPLYEPLQRTLPATLNSRNSRIRVELLDLTHLNRGEWRHRETLINGLGHLHTVILLNGTFDNTLQVLQTLLSQPLLPLLDPPLILVAKLLYQ